MKSVLISIKPKWVDKIINGEKTIEVRKTKPDIETPFKCYIYCTKGETELPIERKINREPEDLCDGYEILYWANGKVIGEFICDIIYMLDFCYSYQDYDYAATFIDNEHFMNLPDCCLTDDEIIEYGKGKTLYGLHITDLKIYDKPKELSEFVKPYVYYNKPVKDWCHNDCVICDEENCKYDRRLTRPPQSWCYVEDLGE